VRLSVGIREHSGDRWFLYIEKRVIFFFRHNIAAGFSSVSFIIKLIFLFRYCSLRANYISCLINYVECTTLSY